MYRGFVCKGTLMVTLRLAENYPIYCWHQHMGDKAYILLTGLHPNIFFTDQWHHSFSKGQWEYPNQSEHLDQRSWWLKITILLTFCQNVANAFHRPRFAMTAADQGGVGGQGRLRRRRVPGGDVMWWRGNHDSSEEEGQCCSTESQGDGGALP